ncbi:hypothetical protein AMIS_4910 [Actinoplanes missouriensis 431]|uniref:Arylsulfatase n=1 Tax=Actinoplanes missouriensis (strain ATCC 14538 / DSM 43046 / CBS 188.64 / JCM 3121 / NBRC 102363 / NCIMB 12654 / NRRL B-3342 / UNCC 431) TaxID=512565 RepID=I0GY74_ACTM4|nr:aspartate/glutamate racemase family protein [Actinoplanes missouriensis]BAL85711.1 hypothetical protein AMIS_4910 [Actinoplanes missouriensis 431]
MPTIGFLHTADVHVATFEGLTAELAPGWTTHHLVDASLLADARVNGVTPEIAARVRDRLAELGSAGADVILCTCSTIGETAEDESESRRVLRVDRPMAEAAVAAGHRIAVVATVASTMEPTMALLRESAAHAGTTITLIPEPCLSSWRHFESGDHDRYFDEIADHVRAIAGTADVVVLAQASMSPAADRLTGLPVLTSPRTAVARATAG